MNTMQIFFYKKETDIVHLKKKLLVFNVHSFVHLSVHPLIGFSELQESSVRL